MVLFCVGCNTNRPERLFIQIEGNRKLCKTCVDNRKMRTGLLQQRKKASKFDPVKHKHRMAIEEHQAYLREQEL